MNGTATAESSGRVRAAVVTGSRAAQTAPSTSTYRSRLSRRRGSYPTASPSPRTHRASRYRYRARPTQSTQTGASPSTTTAVAPTNTNTPSVSTSSRLPSEVSALRVRATHPSRRSSTPATPNSSPGSHPTWPVADSPPAATSPATATTIAPRPIVTHVASVIGCGSGCDRLYRLTLPTSTPSPTRTVPVTVRNRPPTAGLCVTPTTAVATKITSAPSVTPVIAPRVHAPSSDSQ